MKQKVLLIYHDGESHFQIKIFIMTSIKPQLSNKKEIMIESKLRSLKIQLSNRFTVWKLKTNQTNHISIPRTDEKLLFKLQVLRFSNKLKNHLISHLITINCKLTILNTTKMTQSPMLVAILICPQQYIHKKK